MLIAYLDEFGHIGPYIEPGHKRYGTHPVFGYGGFVIPAENVRKLGSFFEFTKESLLDWEIKQSGAHPRRWEKKGASLYTTKNIEKYPELTRATNRLMNRLGQLGGRIFFYGQVKPVGSEKETGESAKERNAHHLRQALMRLSGYAADCDTQVVVVLDAVDNAARQAALETAASFIYAKSSPDSVSCIVEAPMQVESHLYATIQYADWLCGLLGRATHHEYVSGSEFGWASAKFGPKMLSLSVDGVSGVSKIHHPDPQMKDSYAKHVFDPRCHDERLPTPDPGPKKARRTKRTPRPAAPRAISNTIGAKFPDLMERALDN